MDWIINIYESEYFFIILLSVIAILTVLFILIAVLGKKKNEGEVNSKDINVAFKENNQPEVLEITPNSDDNKEVATEILNDINSPENNNVETNIFDNADQYISDDVTPQNEIFESELDPLTASSVDIFAGPPSFETDEFIEPTVTQPTEILFDDEQVTSALVEEITSVHESQIPQEELIPEVEVNTEPAYDKEIELTQQTNNEQFSSVFIDKTPEIIDNQNITEATNFDPFADLELPKPAQDDSEQ